MKTKLKRWELSLLIALCVTVCCGFWAQAEQEKLAGACVRLHVIAESNSAGDQSAKLAVRDSIISALEPMLDGASGRDEALSLLESALPELEEIAGQTLADLGLPYGASAELGIESYPTKRYDGFALPAGRYMSLRVTLGGGEGENWWCVVFPPLCLSAAEGGITSAATGLTEDEVSLVTEENTGYEIKFKLLELWGRLTAKP